MLVFLVEQAIIWDMVVALWNVDLEVISLSARLFNPDEVIDLYFSLKGSRKGSFKTEGHLKLGFSSADA